MTERPQPDREANPAGPDPSGRERLDEELREAGIVAGDIVETIHDPLVVLTPDLHVQVVNPAFYEYFEVAPEETIGRLIYELGNGQWDIPELHTLLEEILPENDSFDVYKVAHEFEDLGWRVMLLNARRLDHLQLILLAIRDITDRAQVEALRAAKEEAEEAKKAAEEANSALRERVKELRTLHEATRILDDAEWALEDRLAAVVDLIPPGWLYPEITQARLVLGEREFVTDGFRETEWVITAPVEFGRQEPGRLEVVLTEARPERDEGPFLREEQELLNDLALLLGERSKRERLAHMLLETGDAVSILAPDGLFLFAKPGQAGEMGYTGPEMEGRNALEMVHPEDRPGVEAALRKLSEEEPGSMKQLQYRAITADGEERHMESVARNLIDHPAISGLVVTTRDVTERYLLEEQLRHGQKLEAVGRLAAGVAHDFNNLLTVVRSQADLLLMDLEEQDVLEPATARPELETIQAAGERAATLTHKLLAFSREQVLQPRTVDLSEISREAMRLVERVVGPDVTVEAHLPEGLPPVRVDPDQFEHVVMNLAINARDAMPEGGVLTLRTRVMDVSADARVAGPPPEAGRYVALDVSDTGTGMDAATVSRIFEPFFTTKETERGTGLGLPMVYGMVTQSGGLVRVESEPGEGTTFTLSFPAVKGEPEPRRMPDRGTAADEEDVQSRRVLIVEDEEAVRDLTARILERAGMIVLAVESGEEGIAELERGGGFDLVLTDFALPGVSGRALVDLLREKGGDVPILVMSGYAVDSPGDRVDLPEDVEFLQKPFTPRTLMQRVREVLGHG
ncbi:MAG: PAS domain-containing protein [Longimicrobiales bacterium]